MRIKGPLLHAQAAGRSAQSSDEVRAGADALAPGRAASFSGSEGFRTALPRVAEKGQDRDEGEETEQWRAPHPMQTAPPSCREPGRGREMRGCTGLGRVSLQSQSTHRAQGPGYLRSTPTHQTSSSFSLSGAENGTGGDELGLRGAHHLHLARTLSFLFALISIQQ